MNLWYAREKSMTWLDNELMQESDLLQQGFDFLDQSIGNFDQFGYLEGETLQGKFSRICGITLAKATRLLLGCYSLTLDGLAQEAGAILRPTIEAYELLVYFRLEPTRVEQVINDRLPKAGEIGQRILGNYKNLREHLNKNASHFSYQMDSMRHLFDSEMKIKSFPNHTIDVFRRNLLVLNAFQVFIVFEVLECFIVIGVDVNEFANEIENWKKKSLAVFPFPKQTDEIN